MRVLEVRCQLLTLRLNTGDPLLMLIEVAEDFLLKMAYDRRIEWSKRQKIWGSWISEWDFTTLNENNMSPGIGKTIKAMDF